MSAHREAKARSPRGWKAKDSAQTVNYKLRDWLFSRQRIGRAVPDHLARRPSRGRAESDLPVSPPDLTDFKSNPSGEPPLARAKEWVKLPDGSTRETNTRPQWAGSLLVLSALSRRARMKARFAVPRRKITG